MERDASIAGRTMAVKMLVIVHCIDIGAVFRRSAVSGG